MHSVIKMLRHNLEKKDRKGGTFLALKDLAHLHLLSSFLNVAQTQSL